MYPPSADVGRLSPDAGRPDRHLRCRIPKRADDMFETAQTVDQAIDEVGRWADSLPGDFSIDITDHDDLTVIEVNGTLIASGIAVAGVDSYDRCACRRCVPFRCAGSRWSPRVAPRPSRRT